MLLLYSFIGYNFSLCYFQSLSFSARLGTYDL